MTTGQLVFYSGVAILALSILLAVVFAVKKPQYNPEAAGRGPGEAGNTRKLRSGYPTDPLTVRREGPETPAQLGTVRLTEEVASGTAVLPEERTALLPEGHAADGILPLTQEEGTVPLEAGTAVLPESKATRPLNLGGKKTDSSGRNDEH